MSRKRKATKVQLLIPWWINVLMGVLSLAFAVILLDFRVVSKVTQFGEIVSDAFGTPVDFAPLLTSLQPILLMGILVLWLGTFITMRKCAGKLFTVSL